MLLFVGFLILICVGGGVSGHRHHPCRGSVEKKHDCVKSELKRWKQAPSKSCWQSEDTHARADLPKPYVSSDCHHDFKVEKKPDCVKSELKRWKQAPSKSCWQSEDTHARADLPKPYVSSDCHHDFEEPSCPKNEHYMRNNQRCIRTCANKGVPTSDDCKPFSGCVCNGRLVRLNDDASGKCVPESKCPNKCKDCHAVYKESLNPCPLTCSHPKPRPCPYAAINKGGCECAPDFVLNEANGRCVRPKDCPVRRCCPKHSHYVIEDNQCQKTCGNRLMTNSDVAGACVPFTGCSCRPGYVRLYDNATGPCIPLKKCPPIPTQCGVNEEATSCRIICPPQTCDSIFSLYYCVPTECEPGCDCKNGYLRNKDGICIPSDDCFEPDPIECGENEVASDCAIQCPPQSCESLYTTYQCAETNCTTGCNCIDGHLRNSLGICVPSEECYNDPAGCEGDVNATRTRGCGSPYPPTCENPNPKLSSDVCKLNGCECKPGYIKSCEDGNCIESQDCPGGSPNCGANQTYVGCIFGCPTNYCPVDDSRAQVACSIPYPCQGGCACKGGYLRVSSDNPQCVLASDCPDVKCTRPNEVLDRNPSSCFLERCEDRGSECNSPYPPGPRCVCEDGYYRNESDICIPVSECPPLECKDDLNATYTECTSYCPLTCEDIGQEPKSCIAACAPAGCACNPGYVLNTDGKCIDPKDCPGCEDTNAVYKGCPSACEPTCAKPDRNQACTRQCMPPGCVCKPEFVLNEKTGKCVEPKTCPVLGCNGDSNATYSECTSHCPLTCEDIGQEPMGCTAVCAPAGCQCNSGYVLHKDGKCIDPEDCPVVDEGCGGDLNATHDDCPSSCPPTCANRYSKEDTVCLAVCDPSGCVCKQGYILIKEGGQCVKTEDCPVPGCEGDPHAVFSDCPSACEPTCTNPDPQICTLQCLPSGCVCKKGYVKNEQTGKCVKREACPVEGCNGDSNATYSECTSHCPLTCEDIGQEPKACIDACAPAGCVCNTGYVLNKDGKCINPEDCPAEPECNGDRNATYTESPEYCQPTCLNPEPEGECMDMSMPPGCVCKQGYILNEKGGRCIDPPDCSGGSPKCKANETYVYCNAGCPTDYCPFDDSLAVIACDPPYPCLGGCACEGGYLMVSEDDDRCILSSECPQLECSRPNEVWDAYAPGCLRERCDDRDIPCHFQYPGPPRCRCIAGYYRHQDDICVPESECPKPGCNGDMNATFSECPSECPKTCGDSPDQICTTACAEPGCICNDGFVRSKPDGVCIKPEDCVEPEPTCGYNEVSVPCRQICPPQNCEIAYTEYACTEETKICEPGCDCLPDHLRNGSGICIPNDQCPYPSTPVCGINEIARDCRRICPPQTCLSKYALFRCIADLPCEPGCDCVPNYLRNAEGICIPSEKCPPLEPEPTCGYNEVSVPCRQICPPQNCEIANTDYACTKESKICEPGCDCLPDHLRNGSGICIPNDQCPYPSTPVCGINEIVRDCKQICPPQSCQSKYIEYNCIQDIPCEPGCDCVSNYLRNDKGICIPSEKCPPPCQIPDKCQRTCASPNPLNCGYNPPKENINGCDCKEGYILSEKGGDCIPIENCPPEVACHGDPNAVPKRCPKPCPSTCDSPDKTPCKRACYALACECKPGYLLSNETGVCILPDKCPGGNPCGKNGRFVDCKVDCPNDYCPIDDSRSLVFCDPEGPCLSGCICNLNNKRKSRKQPKCITSSECRPVNCTRPNEEWSSCPSACLAEDCEDVNNQPTTCNTLVLNCQPRCVCKKNHFRNSSGICIPAEDCPKGCDGDLNAVFNKCPSACEPTCNSQKFDVCTDQCMDPGCVCKPGFVLNEIDGKCTEPENCPVPKCEDDNAVYNSCPSACEPTCASPGPHQVCTDECKPARCVCKEGFVLNEKDGKCVEPEHCPAEIPCHGDPNAVPKRCPKPCPSTCDSPDQTPCKRACYALACECKPGYLLSNETGVCILPDKCPGGNPCGKNGSFVDCKVDCPNDYCPIDDSRSLVLCDPEGPCLSGCICNLNNKRKSRKQPKCITSSECRPVNCTRPNEEWSSCPSACLAEDCEDVNNQPTTCNTLVLNCQPRCVCKKNHFRNSSGICIPAEDCPKGCDGDLNAVFNKCPSACEPTCNSQKFDVCTDQCMDPGCVCKPGFVLNEIDGKCTEPENCPVPKCEDDNAVYNSCPSACEPTCASPGPHQVCTDECKPARCVCKEGFVLNEKDGKCVEPEHCPA